MEPPILWMKLEGGREVQVQCNQHLWNTYDCEALLAGLEM